MDKKVRVSLLIGMALLISFTSFKATQAYLTYQEKALNEFKIGYNTIEVKEEYEPPDKIAPGKDFKKTIQVENTGTIPCYVRVRMEYSDSDMKKYCYNVLGDKEIEAEKYQEEVYRLTNNKWKYNETDGCYYYTEELQPNGKTVNLLDSVKIMTEDKEGNALTDDNMKDFDIYVYAESIQVLINKDSNDGQVAVEADYEDAWNQMLGKEVFKE